jgi:hypothetical protein
MNQIVRLGHTGKMSYLWQATVCIVACVSTQIYHILLKIPDVTLFKKGGEGECDVGLNLFKVHCTHV